MYEYITAEYTCIALNATVYMRTQQTVTTSESIGVSSAHLAPHATKKHAVPWFNSEHQTAMMELRFSERWLGYNALQSTDKWKRYYLSKLQLSTNFTALYPRIWYSSIKCKFIPPKQIFQNARGHVWSISQKCLYTPRKISLPH
jgi:hypothetical protein